MEHHDYTTSDNEPAVDEKYIDHFLSPAGGEALIKSISMTTTHARLLYTKTVWVYSIPNFIFKVKSEVCKF